MDEEVQSVEAPVESAPATDNTPVEQEATQVETPQEMQEPREDNRDFRKAFDAKNNEVKELKAMYDELRASTQSQVQNQAPTSQPETPDEALNVLRQIVNEAVAPITEGKTWDDFEKRPMVSALKPEIVQELGKLSDKLPLAERLETARKNAIVNNLDKIQAAYKEIGVDQAYSNQAGKKATAGLGQSRSQAGQQNDSAVDRALRGEKLSNEEYLENRSAIQQAMREQALGA